VEEMKVSDELPGYIDAPAPALRRLRRNIARLIPMPALEPHGEDGMEEIVEEKASEDYLEELKSSVEICREELEKQIHEHIHRSYDRED
jgi:hypothetical protein